MDPTATTEDRDRDDPRARREARNPHDDGRAVDPETIRRHVGEVYRAVDERLATLQPRCELSGRCCRFRDYDHTLFLCELEAIVLLAEAPPPSRPLDDGATCPWQDDRGRCNAREARPLGCRVFFCDPAYLPHAPQITEEALGLLRRHTEELALPWNYATLHEHLRRARASGRFVDPPATDSGSTGPIRLDTNPVQQYS